MKNRVAALLLALIAVLYRFRTTCPHMEAVSMAVGITATWGCAGPTYHRPPSRLRRVEQDWGVLEVLQWILAIGMDRVDHWNPLELPQKG